MIPVLSLLVAALAVFFGPLVTWTVARKQITVATREAWMREFREQVAALLTSTASFRDHVRTHSTDDPKDEQRLAEINDELTRRHHAIRLLIAERGARYATFIQTMNDMHEAPLMEAAARVNKFYGAAESILLGERTAIETDSGVWHALLANFSKHPPAP